MRCPLCNEKLREVNRRGVHMDVCPECRGSWIDGSEVERLFAVTGMRQPETEERAQLVRADASIRDGVRKHDEDRRHHEDRDDDEPERSDGAGRKARRGGFLGNLMDMVGGGETD